MALPLWFRKFNVGLTVIGFVIIYASNFPLLRLSLGTVVYFTILNLDLCMLLWCFIVLLTIDPGKAEQADEQALVFKKQYCLDCKSLKPDRCHHCSVCARCVLLMDHHCPWVNGCIGFNNRKQFILMLIYANLFILLTIGATYQHITLQQNIFRIIQLIIFIGEVILFFTLSMFLKFHIEILFNNLTTLEDMINKQMTIVF